MCGDHQSDATTLEVTEAAAPTGAASSCCGHAAPDAASTAAPTTGSATSADDATTCPVMVGTPVSKATAEAAGLYRDYEGNRYWLCCAGCGPRFDANPAKYAAA